MKVGPNWLTCSPFFETLWEGRRHEWRGPAQSAYFRNTIGIRGCPNSLKMRFHRTTPAQELELKSSIPTQMWPNVICLSVWLPASCGLILFENLIKGVVIAIISVAWSSWALVSHRLDSPSAEWAEELINYLESLYNYYLNFCTPHLCQVEGEWVLPT